MGSFAAAQHLPEHQFTPSLLFGGRDCSVCGLAEQVKFEPLRLSALRSRQDHLVQFYDLEYAAFDLSTLNEMAPPAPTPADIESLQELFRRLRRVGPDAGLASLEKALRGSFKSNKLQRKYVLEALAITGILCPPGVPSYLDRWVGFDEREGQLQVRHFYARDSAYPLRHWNGAVGVVEAAALHWFGEFLREPNA